jgi:hypothetical protein
VPVANRQLQRTVIPNRWRAARASFHYAHAARWTRGRAADPGRPVKTAILFQCPGDSAFEDPLGCLARMAELE